MLPYLYSGIIDLPADFIFTGGLQIYQQTPNVSADSRFYQRTPDFPADKLTTRCELVDLLLSAEAYFATPVLGFKWLR